VVKPVPNVTEDRDADLSKAFEPIEVTLFGIVIAVSPEARNILAGMAVMPVPILTEVRFDVL
jgi:hypothetical protein